MSIILLILCGSSVSFMVNEVRGYKSPLYGRCTKSMEVLPFNYLESSEFFPKYSIEDKLIANGKNKLSEISDKIKEEKGKCSKYISVLQTIRLLEKKVPCGERIDGKKGLYEITDNFYKFWYRYVFSNKSYYSMLEDSKASEEIVSEINLCQWKNMMIYLLQQLLLKLKPSITTSLANLVLQSL